MSYKLTILSHAHRDFAEIVAWLVKASLQGADRWINAFDEALSSIVQNPSSFGLAPEDEFISIEIRQALFQTKHGRSYRILFTIVEQEVRVLRLRGPGQELLTSSELTS